MIGGIPHTVLWLAVMIILGVIEAATLGLVTIWFAIGALFALIGAYLGLTLQYQIIVFLISSAILLYFTRPIAKNYLKIGNIRTNADRLIGEIGIVTQKIDTIDGTGQVKVMGQIWSAKPLENQTIESDERVEVVKISGVKLVVKEVEKNT